MPEFVQSGYCNVAVATITQECASGQIKVSVRSRRDGQQPLPFTASLMIGSSTARERAAPSGDTWTISNLNPGVYLLKIRPEIGTRHHDFRHLEFGQDFSTTVELLGNDTVVVDMLVSRKESILYDIRYDFKLDDPGSVETEAPWIEISWFSEVSRNTNNIASSATRFGVSADLVKSILYMETTHGYYDRLADPVGLNRTIRPMNVHADFWSRFFSRDGLSQPAANIDAGTFLLSRITDRIPDASIRKIATVYNSLGAEVVTAYGASVERIQKQRSFLPSESLLRRVERDVAWFEALDAMQQIQVLKRLFGGY